MEERDDYVIRTLQQHHGGIECIKCDSQLIISGASDGSINVWNRQLLSPSSPSPSPSPSGNIISNNNSNRLLVNLQGHEDRISCIEFNQYYIVSGSYDRTCKVWDRSGMLSSTPKYTLTGHNGSICCIDLQNRHCLSGSYDNTAKCKLSILSYQSYIIV